MTIPDWRSIVREEQSPEAAGIILELVEHLLNDDVTEVLRQITSELAITMRAMRDENTQALQAASHEALQTVLFHRAAQYGSTEPVTFEAYTQSIAQRVAEAREMLTALKYYTMALSEKQS